MVINVNSDTKLNIALGNQGENAVTTIEFDTSEWLREYGSGELVVVALRSGDYRPYPVELSGNTWIVSDSDTAKKGTGKVQVSWNVDGKIKKSVIHTTTVLPSIDADIAPPPDPYDTWVDKLNAMEEAGQTALQSEGVATAKAEEASQSAEEAYNYARTAYTQASNAQTYASNAGTYASVASTKASQASASADSAAASSETSTNAAAESVSAKNTAVAAKNDAETAANTATTKASEASTSATNAATSASNASTSETNAATSASNASSSAASANTSATDANTDALKAEGYSVGKQNGVAVESGEYFENNAKYYAEQARESAANAIAALQSEPYDLMSIYLQYLKTYADGSVSIGGREFIVNKNKIIVAGTGTSSTYVEINLTGSTLNARSGTMSNFELYDTDFVKADNFVLLTETKKLIISAVGTVHTNSETIRNQFCIVTRTYEGDDPTGANIVRTGILWFSGAIHNAENLSNLIDGCTDFAIYYINKHAAYAEGEVIWRMDYIPVLDAPTT